MYVYMYIYGAHNIDLRQKLQATVSDTIHVHQQLDKGYYDLSNLLISTTDFKFILGCT